MTKLIQWTSVDDEMPDDWEEVLVWVISESGGTSYTESWMDANDGRWAMGSAKNFTVTHWVRVEDPNQ